MKIFKNFYKVLKHPDSINISDFQNTGLNIGFLVTVLLIMIVIFIGVYIYTSWALMTIGRKLKYKRPWLAWIPFANVSMVLQLGEFHWAWVFLLLIPILGWLTLFIFHWAWVFLILIPILGWLALFILLIIATWRIYEKRKYPGVLALISIGYVIPFVSYLAIIANLIVLGIVAWHDRK